MQIRLFHDNDHEEGICIKKKKGIHMKAKKGVREDYNMIF